MKKLVSLLIFPVFAWGQGAQLPKYTVSTLPTASLYPTYTVQVTDGLTAIDCTSGGGTFNVLCTSHGGAWNSVAQASGTTTNALTANSSGGASPGDTFNGSAAKTWDYHTFGAQQALTLTTTGTSGPSTLSGGALNIPQYSAGSTTPNTVLITVAASNSINKTVANYIATGTNDQTTINTAISACPATLTASPGPAQCTVVLMPGVYNIGATVVIDTDDVELRGQGHCMWGGWNGAWSSTSSPAGAIGTGCAQLKSSATGFPIISIKHVNTPAGTGSGAGDSARHRGIKINNLYLIGDGYLNQGIETVGNGGTCNTTFTFGGQTITGCNDDNVEISDNIIQRTNLGIGVALDSPTIKGNSIQDNNGPAEMICGIYARISGELLYDNAGPMMIGCSDDAVYSGNIMGDSPVDGIHLYVSGATVSNNTFVGIVGSGVYVDTASQINITGNLFDWTSNVTTYNLPSSADAVHIVAGASAVNVSGNTFKSSVNQTGYAVNDLGTGNSVGPNTVTGTWRFGSGAPFVVGVQHTQDLVVDSLTPGTAPVCPNGTGGKLTTTACAAGSGMSGMTTGQVPIAATATTVTSSKAIQGTDTNLLSSGTVSGPGATLCTDANGGATTSGCPTGSTGALINITGSGQITATGCTQSASTGGYCSISGTTTTAVTFSVIPGSYLGLHTVIWGQGSAALNVQTTFNSDTGSHYSLVGYFQSGASAPGANSAVNQAFCAGSGLTTTNVSDIISDIPFYADTSFAKIITTHGGEMASTGTSSSNFDLGTSCSWDNGGTPAAITSITYTASTGHFVAGTKFIIYGVN